MSVRTTVELPVMMGPVGRVRVNRRRVAALAGSMVAHSAGPPGVTKTLLARRSTCQPREASAAGEPTPAGTGMVRMSRATWPVAVVVSVRTGDLSRQAAMASPSPSTRARSGARLGRALVPVGVRVVMFWPNRLLRASMGKSTPRSQASSTTVPPPRGGPPASVPK